MTTGDISVYKKFDPDTLYYDYPNGSLTFFYIPNSQKLYVKKYPTNHQEMLIENDDLFNDVFGDYLKRNGLTKNSRTRRELESRGSALTKGYGILGRIGFDYTTPLIAFWKSETTSMDESTIKQLLAVLFENLPGIEGFKSKCVLLLPNREPITIESFLGEKSDFNSEKKREEIPQPKKDQFEIDGRNYSLADLQNMRAEVHTKGKINPVLCHPDIDKYPELSGYKPVNCSGRSTRSSSASNWRDAARRLNIPVFTSESFKEWLEAQEK